MKIFLFDNYSSIDAQEFERLLAFLPKARREKALRFRFMDDRISCAAAYLLFLHGYRNLYGMTDTPDFSEHENKKPYIKGHEDIHFNISHCKGCTVCVFDDYEVGIDVQDMRNCELSVARYSCNDADFALIENSDNPQKEFCKVWSRKESYLKLTGEGIFHDIKAPIPDEIYVKSVFIEPDKFLSIASFHARVVEEIIKIDAFE